MQLNIQLERSGRWLFRWRSYLPFLFLFPLAVAVARSNHDGSHSWADEIWPLVCLAVSIIGLAIRLHCIGHAAPQTSGRNTRHQIANSLNTTGLYSIVRHPLYLANFLIALGIVAQPNNWWLIGLYCAAFALYYERIMFAEEAFLAEKFGEDFRTWAESTPTFIPRLSGYRPATSGLNLKRVLQHEGAAVAVITVSFTIIEIMEHARTDLSLVEPWWFVFAFIGSLAYVASRVYKKLTRPQTDRPGQPAAARATSDIDASTSEPCHS